MANLRILSINVVDSTTITAKFTEFLDPSIGVSNVIIESQLDNVPSPLVLEVSISQDVLTLTTQPLTAQSSYIVTFQSVPGTIFQSLNGDAILFQDGITNKQLIIGPIESDNVVMDFLLNYLKDNIYNADDSSTVVNSILQALSTILSKALYDIRQVKNENYLSFTVVDEQKTRSSGPFDRLLEESAYEIIRVGRTPTGTVSILNVGIDEFPYYPVSLLANEAEDILSSNSINQVGYFNINDFILTVANNNVSKLTGVTFNYSDARPSYQYSIETLGYQILDSLYDQEFGFSYATLSNNQFKLSETILNDSLFSTQNISSVHVQYEFRNLGRIVDPSSVTITTVLKSIRETLPPIINVFNLKHAPITDINGNVQTSNGITFTDPNAGSINAKHPAFITEIPFSLSALPFMPGQYSVDYPTGTVYVYGSDATNSGTGPLPPLATYNYQFTYKNSVDYTYDQDTNALVALPNGSLLDNSGIINFNYEQVFIPGIDYNAETHVEVLSERIENKLLALNIIGVKNFPITNVFRIYNETSGEIYGILRWSNNKIYFNYNTPPNVKQATAERVSFENVLNEILFVNQELTNGSSLKIFKCLLANNKIIAGTEDCIGSFINTSVAFGNSNVFKSEKWWDGSGAVNQTQNINKLTAIGNYQIDYVNGVVYVAVANNQDLNIGTISYKNDSIVPTNPHVISVDDIYNRISILNPKDKTFNYLTFSDGSIIPATFDKSDEGFLNNSLSAAYQVSSNTVGAFINATFVPGVTNNIKFVRSIYEFTDLQNNTNPVNFAESCISSGNLITTAPVTREEFGTVLYDGTHYYVDINLNLPYLSSNLTFTISVIRNSDAAQLWNGSGTIVPGNPVKLVLSGINFPTQGDSVAITYSIQINDLSRVVVDYNKGDYFVDYSYLADEIIVSYEYGDNVLDFRQSQALAPNEEYFATYKVGALRDALLKNFGMLINVPELATLNIDLERERYRDAVTGALESFIVGPTIVSMKNLVAAITHVQPEIIESVFQNWSLGSSLLNPRGVETVGDFELNPAKYGNGVLIDKDNQSIKMPVSSNLKLEQGSFQTWISPQWDGLDNDAPITISVLKDGQPFKNNSVFIGSAEYHPHYTINNNFNLDKNANVVGTPNKNKDGVFVYYDYDPSGLFKRWYCQVIDGYVDGYGGDGYNHTYTIKINTLGKFYDVKSMTNPKPSTLNIQSGTASLNFTINSLYGVREGVTFIADREHYVLDFGTNVNKNRLSIYKDTSGYLNLRVFDNTGASYVISADVSGWQANQLHHVASSWAINSKISRDELHLFIDGFEVPNIIRYGNKVGPYLHERFRTINPEEIAGVVTKNIVGSVDLHTTIGTNTVSSSINFSAYSIGFGDIIFIDEVGFNPSGYTITTVNGNTLTLASTMPATLTDARFSVNRVKVPVTTEISIFPNIAVSTITAAHSATDLVTTQDSNSVSSASLNFTTLGIQPGFLLRVDNVNFAPHYVVLSVTAHSLVLNDEMPLSLTGQTYYIYPNDPVEIPGVRALRPSYSFAQDANYNNLLVLSNDVSANDLIMVTTLGLNHKRTRQKVYQWGSQSNVIQTKLPVPIDLNTVGIYHILFPTTAIKPYPLDGYNATITAGILTSNSFSAEQPSPSDNGRTLQVTISSTNNIDFTTPVTVVISGTGGPETLTFTEVGTQTTTNQFTSVTGIVVSGRPVSGSKTFITLQVQEALSMTQAENSALYPVIKYSYQTKAGVTLSSSGGTTVTDSTGFFSSLDVNNYIVITSPSGPAGTYQIASVSDDHLSAVLTSSVPSFTDGYYQVLNSSTYRNGFQNGYFVFEKAGKPGVPYPVNQGTYEFDFYTYLKIKFDPINVDMYFGTDFNQKANLNGVMDEVKITSNILTDTRIGETVGNNQESITKDFNSLKELIANVNTLVLVHFNDTPFSNVAPFYLASENKAFVQSGSSVNDNFNQSVYITDKPIIIENDGILNSKTEGTIEFWVNPIHDTSNDPNYRFYFDSAGIEVEKVTSLDDVTVQTVGRIGKVLSVTLAAGNPNMDYFSGGKVELSTIGAILETAISTNASTVSLSKKVLQVITVKIANDPTNTEYFANGTISTDGQTLYLGKTLPENNLYLKVTYKPADGSSQTLNSQVIRLNDRLPNQNTPVIVTYVPSGLNGDRISIFKDPAGYVNFAVSASGFDYLVRSPAYWSRGTWHRVKATYSVNGGKGTDTIRLFVDGYERGNVLFGTGLIFGDPHVFGSTFAGQGSGIQTNIKLKDFLGELYIGGDFTQQKSARALIDNFRISNLARPAFAPFGESLDVNYSSNLDMVFPVTEDLYTTFLMDFETLLTKNTDFIMLTDKKSGIFDFSINIFDSFGIVKNSSKVQEVLETLINILKPANSRVFLKYIR